MMSGKLGTSGNKMVYAKGTFLWWRLCVSSFRTIAYIVDKQAVYAENTFCYKDCVCQVSKVQRIYVTDLKWFFFSNLNEKFWKKSTLIWVGFLGVRFYLLAPMRQRVWKPYLHLNSHTYFASCMCDLFDRSLF